MEFEDNDVCEKIINEIEAVFHKDPDLCTFEIINTGENQNKNKSPVIHIEHNLGLESWCARHVYEHSHKRILATTSSSRCLSDSSDHRLFTQQVSSSLLKYLNCAILINPDVATYWNCRRRLFEKNRLNIRGEFQFSAVVLTKKPKSNEAFFYRRWLYSFQSGESIDWQRELALCERCATKSANNYHAWCHRQWILQKTPYFLKYEWQFTEKFIRKHIGDYSGYHHRQFVLRKLFEFCYFDFEANASNDIDCSTLIEFAIQIGLLSDEAKTSSQSLHLTQIILPRRNSANDLNENDRLRTKSLLYCLNLAAGDLKFVQELKELFGYREAFEYHRKAILKFVVEKCLEMDGYSGSPESDDSGGTIDQPLSKIQRTDKCDATKENRFLAAIKRSEGELGDSHRKWCEVFLGFQY